MIRTPQAGEMIRCGSPHTVELIAQANRQSYTRTRYAASVTLEGVTYFWSAS